MDISLLLAVIQSGQGTFYKDILNNFQVTEGTHFCEGQISTLNKCKVFCTLHVVNLDQYLCDVF